MSGVTMEWQNDDGTSAHPPPALTDWEDACSEIGAVYASFVGTTAGRWRLETALGAAEPTATTSPDGPKFPPEPPDLARELRRALTRRGLLVEPA